MVSPKILLHRALSRLDNLFGRGLVVSVGVIAAAGDAIPGVSAGTA
jgi:hypothetical protein